MLISIINKLYKKRESVRNVRYFPKFGLYGIYKTQVKVYASSLGNNL